MLSCFISSYLNGSVSDLELVKNAKNREKEGGMRRRPNTRFKRLIGGSNCPILFLCRILVAVNRSIAYTDACKQCRQCAQIPLSL